MAPAHNQQSFSLDQFVTELIERMNGAGDGPAAREAYREGFTRLRSRLDMYPVSGRRASVVFESAAKTARTLAASCLPLGIAVAMHLYPLCVLQCIPLPLLSVARFQRAMLLRTIRNRSLILANAGGERTRGATIIPGRTSGRRGHSNRWNVRIHVARHRCGRRVLQGAIGRQQQHGAVCGGPAGRLGAYRRLEILRKDAAVGHVFGDICQPRVPHGRYVLVADDEVLHCTSDYQRCWFHLFLAELYLARLERLHQVWGLRRSAEQIMSLNELSQLRAYALRLLDDFSSGSDIEPVEEDDQRDEAARFADGAVDDGLLRGREDLTPADAQRVRADASELCYIKSQPTADEIILRSIGVRPQGAMDHQDLCLRV